MDVSERRGLRARITGSNMLGVIVAADLVLVLVSQFGLGTNLLGRASLSTVTPRATLRCSPLCRASRT